MFALSLLQVSEQSLSLYRQVSSQLGCLIVDISVHDDENNVRRVKTAVENIVSRIAIVTIFICIEKSHWNFIYLRNFMLCNR
jgi:hypothetical protein